MRILLVNGLRTVGGEERTVVDLAAGLHTRGHDVRIACAPGGAFVEEARKSGVAISAIGLRGKESVGAMPELRRVVRRFRPDVVHLHGSYPGILGAFAILGIDVAKIWTIQLPPTWNNPKLQRSGPRRWAYARAFERAARSVDATVCVSGALADGLREFVGAPLPNVTVVHNGVATQSFARCERRGDNFRRAHGIAPDARVVALIGRLTPRKGIDQFVDAVAKLGDGVMGIVAGAGDATSFRARAAARGVSDRVRFLGSVDRVADLVSAIDVGVLPSLAEGLPLCVMEMLAASVPVVLSDIPMHREFLVAGPACTLVPVGDVEAFAQAIARMLACSRDPQVREHARGAAEKHFSSESMISGYLVQYRLAADRRRSTHRSGMVEVPRSVPS